MTTSSDDILAGLLAECSALILAGATIKACLDRHPQHAAALEPLLTTLVDVHALSAVPVRPSAAAARTREQFMTAAVRLAEERRTPPATWWQRLAAWWAGIAALFAPPTGGQMRGMPVGLLATMLVVFIVGVMVTGGVTASARSLPGDLLYPIKTTGERVQLFIARDPVVRSSLEQEFSSRRRQEAQAVAELGRRVNNLPLDGTIEAINGNHWTVSGLDLALDPDAQIIGNPAVGARVHGVLRAPGDGRLIVIYVEVGAPAEGGAVAPTVAPPTATRPASTSTVTATATVEEPAASAAAAPDLPGQRWREPEGWSPALPTATATLTRVPPATSTPKPTAAPAAAPTATSAATLAPTRTDMPPPREEPLKYRIEGWVQSIEGGRWIINGTVVNVNGATKLIDAPCLGCKVSAVVIKEADGSYTALQIKKLAPPEATPEPFECTGIVEAKNGNWWTICGQPIRVSGATIEGDPQVGDLVSVKGERHQSEIWALRITAIRLTEVQFEGIISAVSGSSLVVGGHTVLIDGQTQIIGTPEIGRVAQVAAVQMPDGRLIGKVIMVLDPTPTPTLEPTSTPTTEPTPTQTPEPTSTPTTEPTPTPTPEPTSTPTTEPTPTPTLEPTSTPTMEPTPTQTPEPTSTPTTEPTPTQTPEPTSTATQEAPAG